MKSIAVKAGAILAQVFAAHGLAYFLLTILPDAAYAALGLFAGNVEVANKIRASGSVSYTSVLLDLVRSDLGMGLNGVPVAEQLVQAIQSSAPNIFMVSALLAAGFISIVLWGKPNSVCEWASRLLNFLPPYVIVSLLMLLSLISGVDQLPIMLALLVPPLALLASQVLGLLAVFLQSDHVRFHRSLGASEFKVRQRLVKNTALALLPSVHSIAINLLAALLFVETIFNKGGVGTLAIRAVRTADIKLVLGVVLLFAAWTATVKLLTLATRRLAISE